MGWQGGVPTGAADARNAVQMPAMALMIYGGVGIVSGILMLLWKLLGAGMRMLPAGGAGTGLDSGSTAVALATGTIGVIFSLLGLAVDGFIIYGGMQMRELRSYPIAIAAAILAIVPCSFWTVICCAPFLVGLGVGAWALVVLMKPEVKAAFQS